MFKCPQLAPTDANRVGSALALHRLFAKRDLGEFRGPRVARVFPGSTRNIVAKCRQVMRRALSAADQPLAAVAWGLPLAQRALRQPVQWSRSNQEKTPRAGSCPQSQAKHHLGGPRGSGLAWIVPPPTTPHLLDPRGSQVAQPNA